MTLLEPALALQRAGLSVVPVATDGSKRPAVTWQAYQTTPAPENGIRAWFSGDLYDGLGIICGAVSGNLEMFEVEGRAVDLVPQLAQKMTDNGHDELWRRLCTGYLVRSPSGGMHWVYRVDGPAKPNTKLARRPGAEPNTVDVLIETRGEGGFIVTAPSAGRTHPSGNGWQMIAGGPDTIPTITVAERDVLYMAAREFDTMPAYERLESVGLSATFQADGSVWADVTGLRPGDDYNERADWADILTPHGWQQTARFGQGLGWTRPGKNPRDGISATTGTSDDSADRLYVFSSSTVFDTERPYSKFAAYALLEHGGDYAAAARELRRQGYGDQTAQVTVNSAYDETGLEVEGEAPAIEPTWRPIDLEPILTGTYEPETPQLYPRSDDECLLYRGRVHSFHGESESGKSFAVQIEAARLLKAGGRVLFIDFESDAAAVVGRLLDLGCTADQVRAGFTYVRPDNDPLRFGHELEEYKALLAQSYDLAVVDGMTDALGAFGAGSSDMDEVSAFMRKFPRLLARRTGAAVVIVDHVTKDSDSRGRFAVGSQAKMNGLDGSAFVVEIIEPLGRGMRGAITLRVAKDRPGGVRPHSGMFRKGDRTQESARVVIDSTGGGIDVSVEAPNRTVDSDDATRRSFRPTYYMERISEFLATAGRAVSGKSIEDAVGGNSRIVRQARELLVAEDFISLEMPNKRDRLYSSLKPYTADLDPLSDTYVPPLEDQTSATSANLGQTSAKSGADDLGHAMPPLRGMAEVSRGSDEADLGQVSAEVEEKLNCDICGRSVPRVTIEANRGKCGGCSLL